MTLQQTIDKTREELTKSFKTKQLKTSGAREIYCKKEIKRAFDNAEISDEAREFFGKHPFYEMIEECFIWKAMRKCEV